MKATTKKAFELFLLCLLEESEDKLKNLKVIAESGKVSADHFEQYRLATLEIQKQVISSTTVLTKEFDKLQSAL